MRAGTHGVLVEAGNSPLFAYPTPTRPRPLPSPPRPSPLIDRISPPPPNRAVWSGPRRGRGHGPGGVLIPRPPISLAPEQGMNALCKHCPVLAPLAAWRGILCLPGRAFCALKRAGRFPSFWAGRFFVEWRAHLGRWRGSIGHEDPTLSLSLGPWGLASSCRKRNPWEGYSATLGRRGKGLLSDFPGSFHLRRSFTCELSLAQALCVVAALTLIHLMSLPGAGSVTERTHIQFKYTP